MLVFFWCLSSVQSDKRVRDGIFGKAKEIKYYLRLQEKDFKKIEFSDILFYSEMITKERHERERLALRSAIFPEFMTGKFQEKKLAPGLRKAWG